VEVSAAIRTQRAVRQFAERPIDAGVLTRVLQAGRFAPSSINAQRWQFVLCTERGLLRELAKVGTYAGHVEGAAAAVALVTPRGRSEREHASISFDLGQCARNMMLAAWELGIGSVHASVHQEGLARDLLGYPDDHTCEYLISLGYPAEPYDKTMRIPGHARRPLEELLHRERWSAAR
jgi:nitroreductase